MTSIRPAAVAGSFYPSAASELRTLLEDFERAARFATGCAFEVEKCVIEASGYHSLTSFHKDDNAAGRLQGGFAARARAGRIQRQQPAEHPCRILNN